MRAGMSLRGCALSCGKSTVGSVGDSSFVGLDIDRCGFSSCIRLVGCLVSEYLAAFDEASLGVLAAVYKIGVVEGKLDCAVDDVVRSLDTKHEAVILVA